MYKNILVAVDGSPTSDLALSEAAKLAADGMTIRVMTVVENPTWSIPLEYGVIYDVELMRQSLLQGSKDLLERARQQMAEHGLEVKTHLVDLTQEKSNGIPQAIMREADAWPADLIVIGTHGRRGFRRLLMGSVAEHIVRLATRPVLLTRGPGKSEAQAREDADNARKLLFSDWPEDELIGS